MTVVERNKPDDTFGWGVVLSAETLDNLTSNDPVSAVWIRRYFAYWDDIAVIHKGVRTRLDRPRLLRHRPQAAADAACSERARELGVDLGLRDRGRRIPGPTWRRMIWSSPPTA